MTNGTDQYPKRCQNCEQQGLVNETDENRLICLSCGWRLRYLHTDADR